MGGVERIQAARAGICQDGPMGSVGSKCGQAAEAEKRDLPAEGERLRERGADPDAGVRAGSGPDGDAIGLKRAF